MSYGSIRKVKILTKNIMVHQVLFAKLLMKTRILVCYKHLILGLAGGLGLCPTHLLAALVWGEQKN